MSPTPSQPHTANIPPASPSFMARFEQECAAQGIGPNETALRKMLLTFFEAGCVLRKAQDVEAARLAALVPAAEQI